MLTSTPFKCFKKESLDLDSKNGFLVVVNGVV
jgi:hypothetical protein